MGDVHYVVDKLISPPFNFQVSLVSLSEKGPQELLQLLSDVFARISPKHQKFDVSKESSDETADRLIAFLKIVKYKPLLDAPTFRQLLSEGDKDLIYQILKWVLPAPDVLEKRAFVGYYLSFPDMPDEMNYDPDVADLKDDMRQLQQEFIEVHKEAEAAKAGSRDLPALKQRIKQLGEEKERLVEKVERARGQVAGLPDKGAYLEACTALRKQQDTEISLSQQLQAQGQQLERVEAAAQRAAARLQELQASSADGSGGRLLEALQEEVTALRDQVQDKYPREVERRQKRLQAVHAALGNGVNTEMDLQRLLGQVGQLNAAIAQINERMSTADKARARDKAYLQVRQAQQMASIVARKREEIQAKLDRLQEKKDALTAQYERQAGAAGSSSSNSTGGAISEEEWRQKYESMKSKLPTYKKMKKELGEIEAEAFVLLRTLEVLQLQEREAAQAVHHAESNQGVQGFSSVAADLEKVSEAKSAIDEAKGTTLQEISTTVDGINAAIKERKNKLAPRIKQLRSAREQFQALEVEHNTKKEAYDAAMSSTEARLAATETDVGVLRSEVVDCDSKAYLMSCQLQVVDANIKRVANPTEAERLRESYQQQLDEAESIQSMLQDKQRHIKETHNLGLSQIDMMNDLVKLLKVKLDLHKGGGGFGDYDMGAPTAMAPSFINTATANVMVL